MAYNYEYPYTDPNRFNSDWILSEMKRVIAEWAETLTAWNDTREEWEALRAYVQNYFDNLDVQEEINKKLDQMAADGSLLAILMPYIGQIEAVQDARIEVVENQIREFVALPEGATIETAELHDIRVPAPGFHGGVNYASAGDAVRGQTSDVNNRITSLVEITENILECQMEIRTYAGLTNSIENGIVTINGTSTGASVWNYWDGTLQPGTYTITSGNSRIRSQLLDRDASSTTYIVNAMGTTTFELAEVKNVRYRFNIPLGTYDNEKIKPMLVSGAKMLPYIPHETAIDWRYRNSTGREVQSISVVEFKNYIAYDEASHVATIPAASRIIVNDSRVDISERTIDLTLENRQAVVYIVYDSIAEAFALRKFLDDIDPIRDYLFAIVRFDTATSYHIANVTSAAPWSIADLTSVKDQMYVDIQTLLDNSGALPDTVVRTYIDEPGENIGNNEGVKVKVMSYNVGHYANGSGQLVGFPSDIYAEKAANFKKLLMHTGADIIGTQEDSATCLRDGDRNPNTYLFAPIYPNTVGDSGARIRSKYAVTSSGVLTFTSGRGARWAHVNIAGKDTLVMSAHPTPGDSVQASEIRLHEYEELFGYVADATWDAAIITGDFNSSTEGDLLTLKGLAAEASMTLANGGYLGWIVSNTKNESLDNIIVSSNCIINDIEVLSSWERKLYSDHFPIVADITIK